MSENKSAAGLVVETPSPAHNTADPAVKLDPAKTLPPAPAVKKGKKKPGSFAKRVAAAATSSKAKNAKTEAASSAAIASEEHARAHADEQRAAFEAAKAHHVQHFAELPEGEALTMRFAQGSHFVGNAIEVEREDFVPSAQKPRVTYAKPIDVGPDGDLVQVNQVWVVADSGDAVMCQVGPLVGGNGHHAQIPAGHLLF